MMTVLTLEEAQARLPDLIQNLTPGVDVLITANNQPVARLMSEPRRQQQPRKAGSAKGVLTIVRENDDHLRDFAEYMP
jgi:antitoxin (DNA-binding transcriptional repressor) of toxin-antitoxin stability system